MLKYALTLDTSDTWWGLSFVLAARLTAKERMALALMALRSLDADNATQTAKAALGGVQAGPPQAPFLSAMNEAEDWACFASATELKAYALASYKRLSPKDQAGFLFHVGRVSA